MHVTLFAVIGDSKMSKVTELKRIGSTYTPIKSLEELVSEWVERVSSDNYSHNKWVEAASKGGSVKIVALEGSDEWDNIVDAHVFTVKPSRGLTAKKAKKNER